jgi:hypothetical protein
VTALVGVTAHAIVGIDFSNDKQLRARFPFGTAALKHCP